MTKWVICSDRSGGPLYCPADPSGLPRFDINWAPWTPWMEYAKKFESREDADAFLVGLALEGYPMEDRPPVVLVAD